MIKYYKINLSTTNAALESLSNKIKSNSGYKNDSIIVALDTNRIYYHSPANGSQAILIGNTDRYIKLNNSSSDTQVLKPNTNYYQDGVGYTYTLPTNYTNLAAGDVINLFINGEPASDVHVNNLSGGGNIPAAIAEKNNFRFLWNGSVWIPLTASLIEGTEALKVPPVSYASPVNTFNKFNQTYTAGFDDLSSDTGVVTGTTLYNSVFGFAQAITGDLYTTKEIDKTILVSHLPSAITTIKASTVAGGVYSNTGTWGITQIEGSYTDSVISGSKLPMAASAIYYYVSGALEDAQGAVTGLSVEGPVGTTYNATVTDKVIKLDTVILGGYTKAAISGSPKPMAASAVYNYVKDNVDLTDTISAISLDGSTFTGTSRVANLGTISVKKNGTVFNANTSHQIDIGTGYVQITLGGTNHAGWYVQKTEDGYKLDQGVATLSSLKTITSFNSSSNYQIDAGAEAIPVMLQTGAGNIYPIEKGTMKLVSNTGHYMIDVRPYMVYDNTTTFDGPWTVYYGAGINSIYTTANTVQPRIDVAQSASSQSISFNNGDVAVLSTLGSSNSVLNLLITDLPPGHGMIIKVDNAAGRLIKFATRSIITSAGTYSFSVFNFGEGAQQVGEVTNVYGVQVLP